ncbi:MAG: hypothetical protein CVV62_01890 [Tenericutes bacterium HGW-Tenericutes-7]|nr:MAG: hypothetical protein CVV62_01890 [Tenericutes bacterium HGW-Tenericutes-7]
MKNLILFLFTFIIVQTQAQILSEKERSEIRDQIIEDRLVNLLPQLMDRADIDMWIVMSREYNEDPVIRSMLPSKWFAARRRTILVFYRDKANNLTERLAVSTYDVGKHIKTASLMIQKEVCDRLLAKPDSKQYNALSVILQYHAHVSKMLDVKRHMFYPVPNVDSAVIRIIKREKPLLEEPLESLFINIVKHAFKQKRKTLVNNLHEGFELPKDDIINILNSINLKSDTRAEALTQEDFIKLTEVWPI